MTLINIGMSEAGKRIIQAGIDYQKSVTPEPEPLEECPGILDSSVAPGRPGIDQCRSIMLEECEKAGITVRDIISDIRTHTIVRTRQLIYYRCVTETSLSYPQIGRQIGGRDHSTIIHGARSHAKREGLEIPRR